MKQKWKNDQGVAWYLIFAITLLFLVLTATVFFSYVNIQLGLNNIKDKIKLELNNTSAQATELIFDDMAERNMDSYLESFHRHESELKGRFTERLKTTMRMDTSEYTIDPGTIQLDFETHDHYIDYVFTCQAQFRLYLFGAYRPLLTAPLQISARHYFKLEAQNSIPDFSNHPEQKEEHHLGGGTP